MITDLIESAIALAVLLEATGEYYYEDITLKRWILGGGNACEDCEENADEGWIEEDDFFPADGQFGPVDEPPLHFNCDCTVEYKDTVRRVYVKKRV